MEDATDDFEAIIFVGIVVSSRLGEIDLTTGGPDLIY
jgi:hypothetical protein